MSRFVSSRGGTRAPSPWLVASLASLCLHTACTDGPMDLRPSDTPPPTTAVAIACRVDVSGASAACASGAPGLGPSQGMAMSAALAAAPAMPGLPSGGMDVVDLGGQGSTVGVDLIDLGLSGDTLLVATVQLTNRLDQPLGMVSAVGVDPAAVRFGIVDGPVALPTGTVTIVGADGEATFTAANQPFARFRAPIQPNGREWRDLRFRLTPGVTSFTFRAIVRAALPDESASRTTGQPVQFGSVSLARFDLGGCAITAETQMPYCFGNDNEGQGGTGRGVIAAPELAGHGRFTRLVTTGLGGLCGFRVDERAFCWGVLPFGVAEVPAFNSLGASLPRRVFSGIVARQLAIGETVGCALDARGQAWCAGDNAFGQVGRGEFGGLASVSRVIGGLTFRSLAAGRDFVCGVTEGRGLWCWGANEVGQLGSGSFTSRAAPTQVSAITDSVAQVVATTDAACALTQGGAVWCWGNNEQGTVGIGNAGFFFSTPQRVIDAGVVQLAAGFLHVCARRSSGTIDCWGDNQSGQTGTSQPGNAPAPTPIDASGYTADSLAAGGAVSCFRQVAAWTCFGANTNGEAGVSPAGGLPGPTPVPGLVGLRQVSLVTQGGCGLTATDDVWCWGLRSGLQFPPGGDQFALGLPTGVYGGRAFAQVEQGLSWACGMRPGGGVYCWGRNPVTGVRSATPDTLFAAVGFRRISLGATHACGLSQADSTAWCWGTNNQGELGVAGLQSATPVQVSGGQRFSEIGAGNTVTCGLSLADSTAWCWGRNNEGQLGRGTPGPGTNATPQRVSGTQRFIGLAVGSGTVCGITPTRGSVCWGSNEGNVLGLGDAVPLSAAPVQTIGILQVRQLAISGRFACGVSMSGEVFCGGEGPLGTSFFERGTLRRVPLPVPAASVSVGVGSACAIDLNGRLWCWGSVTGSISSATPELVLLR